MHHPPPRRRPASAPRLLGLAAALVVAGASLLLAACEPAPAFLHVTASAPPATQGPGQSATSTVTATNTGGADTAASTVSITYTRPGGNLAISFAASPGVSCSVNAPRYGSYVATCQVPALAPAASLALATLTVTAPASLPYTGYNASLTATGPDDSASVAFRARDVGPANLVPSAYVTPTTSLVGRPVTANVTISDQGYGAADAFTSVITLPVGSVPAALTPPAGTECAAADHVLTCTTASLGNGQSIGLVVGFTAPSSAVLGTVAVEVDTTAAVPEGDEGDNVATAALDVRAAAAALVPSVVNPPKVDQGALFVRTLTVTNTGGATATAVTVADRFSTITFVDATGPAGTSCTLATSYSGRPPTLHKIGANCSFGDLAPGESKTVALRLSVAGNAAVGAYSENVTASTTAFVDPLVNPTTTATTTVAVPTVVSPPTNLGAPTFTGNLDTGSVVTGTPGTWLSYGTPTYAVAWHRCDGGGACTPIPGATASSYTVQGADVGFRLAYVVTASNAGGSTAQSSALQGPVVAAVAPTVALAPRLVPGLEKQPNYSWGVDPGTWDGTPTITYAYQWRRCAIAGGSCVDIPGATSSAYTLQDADVFHSVQVLVTATNTAGSASALSDLSGEIDPYEAP